MSQKLVFFRRGTYMHVRTVAREQYLTTCIQCIVASDDGHTIHTVNSKEVQ